MLLALIGSIAMSAGGPASCCGDMSAFLSDPAFLAAHVPPHSLHFKARSGSDVKFKASDGSRANGFFVPSNPGVRTAIVMVHEFWGLNDWIKQEAEKVHDSTGYAVLAVDLYDGKVTKSAQEAGALMQAANKNPARCTAIVAGAVTDLKNGELGTKFAKIGTIGYCFGGGWSDEAAIQGGKNVQACVMYYGMPDTSPEALAKLKAPVLMIHATKDQWINQKVCDDFQAAMDKAGKPLRILNYDAVHAFANPSNPNYDKKSADDAYAHVMAFYKKNLG